MERVEGNIRRYPLYIGIPTDTAPRDALPDTALVRPSTGLLENGSEDLVEEIV